MLEVSTYNHSVILEKNGKKYAKSQKELLKCFLENKLSENFGKFFVREKTWKF